MRRSALDTVVLAVIVVLSLFTAAWAAGAPLPLVPVQPSGQSARATIRSTSGPLLTSSLGGQAILVAQNLMPGQTRSSDITVGNDGDDAGDMTLSEQDLDNGGSTVHLSSLLDMLVQDITDPHNPSMVWGGKVDDLSTVKLGAFAPGEQHTYRFFVTYPNGHSAALDNLYQGKVTHMTFVWTASGVAAPTTTTTTTPPPATVAPPATTVAPPVNTNPAVIEDHVQQSANPGTLKLRVYVRRTQAAHRKQVYVNVYCNHSCALTATGVVSLPSAHKKWTMRALKGTVKKNGTVKFKLALPKKALGPLNKALLHRKKASVKLKITAKAGKQTLHWTRTIHLAR